MLIRAKGWGRGGRSRECVRVRCFPPPLPLAPSGLERLEGIEDLARVRVRVRG